MLTSVSIAPAAPTTNQVLRAVVAAVDANGDSIAFSFVWRKNGVVIAAATAATLDLAAPGNGDYADAITVMVTPSDGLAVGAPLTSAAATVTLPPASVFLSTTGNDADPCTASAPCANFQRAYDVAESGDVVEVAGGSYGDQPLHFDPLKTSPDDVVFRPAVGGAVTLDDMDFGADRTDPGASHVTIMDMTLTGDVSIPGCGVPDNTPCPPDATSPGNDLTFRNLRVKGPFAFYCASCSNVSLIGGIWGPDTYECRPGRFSSAHPEIQSAFTQVKRAHGILIDGVTWQNFARCTTADHTECLQVEPADDLVIRNSVFRKCDTIVVNLANDLSNAPSAAGYDAPNNVLIENNVFSEATDSTGGGTFYALNIRECSNCTIRYNSWVQPPRMPDGETHENVQFIGNVGPFNSDACLTDVTFLHNVWEGAKCGPTDKNVANVLFANRGALDLRLLAGSPAIGAGDPSNVPSTDATGRPRTGTPDAGAFSFL
ncbi:MAG TPA: choice-of-anchor Q domain-containing protein [Gaiellaceae bacterium]